MQRPEISFVVTVYNKAPYLDELFASLRDQLPGDETEFIFVDDRSTDSSVEVLNDLRDALPEGLRSRFHILETGRNAGPAVASNVGWRAASGRYVHFVDADDRLPEGATRVMRDLADREDADLVYGRYAILAVGRRRITLRDAGYRVADDPLPYLIRRKIVGPRFLARLEALRAGGGADETIFVQDCSLPWRTAAASRRMVALDVVVQEARMVEGQLSANRAQELHDFLAAALALLDGHADSLGAAAAVLRRRCLERLFKHGRGVWPLAPRLQFLMLGWAAGAGLANPARADAAIRRGVDLIAATGQVRRPA